MFGALGSFLSLLLKRKLDPPELLNDLFQDILVSGALQIETLFGELSLQTLQVFLDVVLDFEGVRRVFYALVPKLHLHSLQLKLQLLVFLDEGLVFDFLVLELLLREVDLLQHFVLVFLELLQVLRETLVILLDLEVLYFLEVQLPLQVADLSVSLLQFFQLEDVSASIFVTRMSFSLQIGVVRLAFHPSGLHASLLIPYVEFDVLFHREEMVIRVYLGGVFTHFEQFLVSVTPLSGLRESLLEIIFVGCFVLMGEVGSPLVHVFGVVSRLAVFEVGDWP